MSRFLEIVSGLMNRHYLQFLNGINKFIIGIHIAKNGDLASLDATERQINKYVCPVNNFVHVT